VPSKRFCIGVVQPSDNGIDLSSETVYYLFFDHHLSNFLRSEEKNIQQNSGVVDVKSFLQL